jgi:hypothetical protein
MPLFYGRTGVQFPRAAAAAAAATTAGKYTNVGRLELLVNNYIYN